MSLVLLEDLRKPLPKRRYAFVQSFRIFRPVVKATRFAYRGSRFLLRQAIAVIRSNKGQTSHEEVQVVKQQH
ncbi:hypothetical protein CIG75_10010 [Tumebacillus algifaecis]|uniref:Uncharacterized protein n=1 Tax=Tumebacillus algifaecis TaxID=1214604 RepID=A0A223D0W7_9BACL|nr:hypothetical protein [Tumebacillus algifaecis]ASS75288.1 hypothetical protein CIG75_10010 [Tumebacillus algifaecis]